MLRRLWPATIFFALVGAAALVGFNASGLAGAPSAGLPAGFIFPGNDLVVYLRAGLAVLARASPYTRPPWPGTDVFHYSPAAALAFAWLAQAATALAGALPFRALAYGYLAVIVAAWGLAGWLWRAVFRDLFPEQPGLWRAWLPFWLVYSQWFADQNYLNLYSLLVALAGALALALLRGRLGLAILLAALILQTKPHYAFLLMLPCLSGHWRLAARLWAGVAVAYLGIAGLTLWAVGWSYGLSLYGDYLYFLATIPQGYPWSGHYLGLNHSWLSILHWLFGLQPWAPFAAGGLKLITGLPLAWRGWVWLRRPPLPGHPAAALGFALALHLWLLTTLDQLWEVSLAVVAAAYLWGAGSARARWWGAVIGGGFALVGLLQLGVWRLALAWGWSMDALDPTAHLPILMLVALSLYGLTLWTADRPKRL
jgi:hypothetical protein